MKPGDFSGLAQDYSKFRPGYSATVSSTIARLPGPPARDLDVADVGAGTGIWSRMLCAEGFRSVTAVEPNTDMRQTGQADAAHLPIRWLDGTGENTGLSDNSVDILTMASSFHWVDFDKGVVEFARALRPGGWFVALWNPRLIELNPVLVEIENHLQVLKPDISRVSSGRSGRTEGLLDRLDQRAEFDAVLYLEGRHQIRQTLEQYLGVWRSVNDIQAQLGPQKFEAFLAFIQERLSGQPFIETTYATRAWAARRK